VYFLLTLSAVFLFLAVGSSDAAWKIQDGPLKTRWAKNVSPADPHPEYPRPQMVRSEWKNLNGLWNYSIPAQEGISASKGEILVPFPVESALSGVMKSTHHIRYTRTFEVPAGWSGRVLLHFGAVDWQATVSVNGKTLGEHKGGYDPFSFDITNALKAGGRQELVVDVYDPSDAGGQPRGKQVNHPEGIWYTPSTGIWQTVWLESVPNAYIADIHSVPDVDNDRLHLTVTGAHADGLTAHAAAYAGSKKVAEVTGAPGSELSLSIPNPHLWGPGDPYLYRLKVSLRKGGRVVDSVDSYFGMRKIEIKSDGKVNRIMVNGKFIFQVGPLDQGFWPDGLYTAPTDKAMKYDIDAAKAFGFNMIRKHVKVEPARWYYYTDKMGMLVWQDMPSGDHRTAAEKKQFEHELHQMIEARKNHPSIIMWVPFNEGWGQYDTERITDLVRGWDPSRLIDNPSGWTDVGVGDVHDTHSYPAPAAQAPAGKRASVTGEFGGLGLSVKGHMWSEDAWGYSGLRGTKAELSRQYENVFRKGYRLKDDPGISALVYTQITDVEHEANGLLTYDRAVIKMDRSHIVKVTTGQFPPYVPPTVVVPTAKDGPQTWRYTTTKPAEDWNAPDFDDSDWKEGPSGFGTEGTPGAVVRTVWNTPDIWIRRTVSLPAGSKRGYALLLHHDEDARVFINGVPAAHVGGFTSDYDEYPISLDAIAALKTGDNVIAIHCTQTTGGQYIDAGLVKR
jgi:hypothetical protein